MRYMGGDEEQAFSSFGLGRDFSKRKSEPSLGVGKGWPAFWGAVVTEWRLMPLAVLPIDLYPAIKIILTYALAGG